MGHYDSSYAFDEQEKKVPWHGDNPLAQRHGFPWSVNETKTLQTMVASGVPIGAIAQTLQRTESAIDYAVEKLNAEKLNADISVPKKGTKIVNMNHLITMLQKGYTTLEVTFSQGPKYGREATYTYKVSNAMATALKPNDQVVVSAKDALKVVWVVKIHDAPQIDVKAPYDLKWVVCKVDRTVYDDQMAREAEAIKKLEAAERLKAQNEALAALLEGMGDREEFFKLINA